MGFRITPGTGPAPDKTIIVIATIMLVVVLMVVPWVGLRLSVPAWVLVWVRALTAALARARALVLQVRALASVPAQGHL